MSTTQGQSVVSIFSENPETSRAETRLTSEEFTEPLASFSSKDDIELSECSDEAEKLAMQTLDNLVEQVP